MFIAHLPAGYLLAKTIRLRTPGRKAVMTAALLGAIAPDLDLFYFYTLDGRQHHHHSYWTHYPSVWFALMLLAWGARRIKPWSTGGTWLLIFSMSGFLHLHRGRPPSPGSVVHALSRAGHCPGAIPPLVAELPAALVFFSGIAHHCRFHLYHGFWQKEDGISLRKSIFYRNP